MARFKLTLAYDGAPFDGWQSQPAANAVQDHLEAALAAVAGVRLRAHGAGRTDAGVHALGQVAHFDAPGESRMDAAAWLRALNTKLPRALRVVASEAAPPDFHARFSAVAKTYRYEIDTAPVPHPLRRDRAWQRPSPPIDAALLREACALVVGRHDFAAFAANRRDGKDPATERTIAAAAVDRPGAERLAVTLTGDGFLYKMVRLLVGGAVRVAEGRAPLSWIQQLLDNPGGGKCQYCAPAAGLYLVEVDYGGARVTG